MKFQRVRAILALAAIVAFHSNASASIVWQESINGDLSNTQASPTAIVLASGTNSVLGSINSSGDVRDFLTITVPVGFQMTQYNNIAYSGSDQGFTGFRTGSAITGAVGTSSSFNGWSHYGIAANNTFINSFSSFNSIGQNLLPIMQSQSTGANQALGFTIPLAGNQDYAFLIQNTSGSGTYQFDFVVTPVPEPSSMILLGLGATAGIARWRRRRS